MRIDYGYNVRVLITGSSGFVGRALGMRLARDVDVIGTVRRPVDLPWQTHICDWIVDEPRTFSGKRIDVLVHAASQAPIPDADPIESFVRNEQMAINVATFAKAAHVPHVVLLSSGNIYRQQPEEITESTPLAGLSGPAYSRSCEQIEEMFRRSLHDRLLTLARLFFPYGPCQRSDKLVLRIARRILLDLPIEIENGSGPKLNPIYVTDLAEALARLSLRNTNGTTVSNVGGPETVSVWELGERIACILGKQCSFAIRNPEQQAESLFCSIEPLTKLTGFSPSIRLFDGLPRTLQNFSPRVLHGQSR